jgi:hypothetical protein
MRKVTVPLAFAVIGALITGAVISVATSAGRFYPQARPVNSYAEDRANKARSRSYWFHYSNDNPDRKGVFDGFGHYEDELIKVNGKWLFTQRRIYNEGRDSWAYKGDKSPAW